jgi:hypothetical protein
MPVSSTATSTSTLPVPSPARAELSSPSMRSMPVGSVWALAETVRSATTDSTPAWRATAAAARADIRAA